MLRLLLNLLTAAFLVAACGQDQPPASSPAATGEPQATPTPEPIAPAGPDPRLATLPEPYALANLANGRRTFQMCRSCHLISAEGRHSVGPNLHGVFSREAGAAEGFSYSPALRDADFLWSPEELNAWLTSPTTFLPGNRMSFAGLRRERDRTDLIAWLLLETAVDAAQE